MIGGVESAPSAAETHISIVFFSADRAYKVLKPIRTSFLDHSTTELRLKAVDQEIELNRRLAPDVYLGSADIVEAGEVVDRMIVMRRLPASRRLSALITEPGFESCVHAVARRLASFHAAQDPVIGTRAAAIASAHAVSHNWHDNFTDLRPLVGPVLAAADMARVQYLVEKYLSHRGSLFERRIDGGLIRDGHGDLTAQDIFCLPDGPRILDCLAFDPALRIGDVLADVAFLAMDLDRLAPAGTAKRFVDAYGEFSNEHHPASLVRHFIAYRAHVRAKVAGIRYRQGDHEAAAEVRGYHDLCLRHLERADPVLLLVGGAPGTGKTTMASELATALEAMTLGSDELRKDLVGQDHQTHEVAQPDEGIYRPEITDRTYTELLYQAGQLLAQGESVVLDASWADEARRRSARSLALELGATTIECECTLDPTRAQARIAARMAEGHDASDASPELSKVLRARREPWPKATTIATDEPPPLALQRLIDRSPALARRVIDQTGG